MKRKTKRGITFLLIISLLYLLMGCKAINFTPYKYHIKWLESDTETYCDVLPAVDKYPEDAKVYQLRNNKYNLILRVYE